MAMKALLPATLGLVSVLSLDGTSAAGELPRDFFEEALRLHRVPAFAHAGMYGYEYLKDTIIGQERPGESWRDHRAAMKVLRFWPGGFFPFHVVAKSHIKSIMLGQTYDLVSRIDPMHLPPGRHPVLVTRVTPTSFTFTALPGHFDPPGSTITFSTWVDPRGAIHLEQYGHVVSPDPSPMFLAAPRAAAKAWDEMAVQLGEWLDQGGFRNNRL